MFALLALVSCDTYAVLIAGSKGYRNYRHQSDVFQAYQLLRHRQIKRENIILFAYDDIVDCPENPMRGQVFNVKKNVSVYPGRDRIDYRGDDVNPTKVEAVLTGNREVAGGRVLNSTDNDDVFLFYNDHGMRGLLCMPTGFEQWNAEGVRNTILEMGKKKMFKHLFFAIESCFSGSVGNMLADIPHVSVITAANDRQSSYSFGYDEDIKVFRTNEFSYNLFQSMLKYPQSTLEELWKGVKNTTRGSEVQSFGDMTLRLENFVGTDDPIDMAFENAEMIEPTGELVSSLDTEIRYLKEKIKEATTYEAKRYWQQRLYAELRRRGLSKVTMQKIAAPFTDGNVNEVAENFPEHPKWRCYSRSVEEFSRSCGDLGEYELSRMSMFANLCQDHNERDIVARIHQVCPNRLWNL